MLSVRIRGTPGSAKGGDTAAFPESGRAIWGWSFMAISPIASPTLPQAGQAGGGDPVRSPVPRRGPVRCARDEETGMSWTDERIENLRTMWERSEEQTSELKSLMRISYAVFCLKNKTKQ